MKLPDRDAENSKEQSEHFCRAISTIGKTTKLVGSGAFSDSVMSFLRGFNNRDDIEDLMDHKQNVIAFSNGYLYDITTDDYRRINKDDFITKTMSIPYNNNVSDSKANEIYRMTSTIPLESIMRIAIYQQTRTTQCINR